MLNTSSLSGKSPIKFQFKTFEKLPVKIWDDSRAASLHVAKSIALAIRQKQQDGEKIVLGLATGSSPIKLYQELVNMHRNEGLSFQNVITFNLDEYYPMPKEAPQSYWRFMHEHLFNHVDIPPENIHIPDGTIPMEKVSEYCQWYEKQIDLAGGIDIQVLGIGRTGHIGFNEPGSWETSLTRMVRLDGLTRRDAIKDFIYEEAVPTRAITMGIGSIMKARTIYLLAWGQHKADIIKEAVEGPVSAQVPASFLQKHNNVRVILDRAAAESLTRTTAPWLCGMVNWTEDLACQAVVWAAQKTGKPILKLTNEDYNEHGLSELMLEENGAYDLNIKIFNRLQHTITGWPGGKAGSDDSTRPERANPARKRCIIFSPHPDDDVISMGGTFMRLVEQKHDVHVAYQTSGNIAVHDYDARRYVEFQREYMASQGMLSENLDNHYQMILDFLAAKKTGQADIPEVRAIKGLIRRGEARAGARYSGIDDDHIHFLDMPFYETGHVHKGDLTDADIDLVANLLNSVKPHQVYAAGDLADPHGTHRVCLEAILAAFEKLKGEAWMQDCWLWLYRGAWHEFPIHEIDMAVPMSPDQVARKQKAIFMHQSQKDRPPFPGEDDREFWQRAKDRNKATAELYRQLGLAEYEAMEAFARWRFEWQKVR
ncbi:MAG: glucosamine-6-phosphate deaminase [Saprospirales bacterium]|nr:glucosamine-6-phosphate deaminase [Saprospirales bacterium]